MQAAELQPEVPYQHNRLGGKAKGPRGQSSAQKMFTLYRDCDLDQRAVGMMAMKRISRMYRAKCFSFNAISLMTIFIACSLLEHGRLGREISRVIFRCL